MRVTLLLPLLGLCTLGNDDAKQQRRDNFKEICGRPPKETKDYGNGYTVRYFCNKAAAPEHLTHQIDAATPDECAIHCKGNPDCKGVVWSWADGVCRPFGYNVGPYVTRIGAVVLQKESDDSATEQPQKPAGDCSAIQAELDQCRQNYETLDGQLQQCSMTILHKELECQEKLENKQKELDECLAKQSSGGDCAAQLEAQGEACAAELEDLEDALRKCQEEKEQEVGACQDKCKEDLDKEKDKCKDQLAEKDKEIEECKGGTSISDSDLQEILEEMQGCPSMQGTSRTIQGVTYQLYCNQKPAGSVYRKEELFWRACLAACSRDKKCQGVTYLPVERERCQMTDYYTPSPGPLGTTFLFGAIPTSKR
ncbi:hypothetical protein BO94DRAFT_605427 [Aspergillus sclerotioniger CBS 115572]|uniref:Apple domain-containing protein n=1 Tax=Aspergillus sclerotioniger CBS 115572 TaxID=1450535 RepID=A0A317VSX8_9EURO|nr:hypothetical protein BO94DRAFT_605427 [Aspergillus sclerotioniger CBS 115572]PWY76127.1 hypothetical protein BO94DRAFT_605427 [Aspergillus sclerotioniger CBS 115572]